MTIKFLGLFIIFSCLPVGAMAAGVSVTPSSLIYYLPVKSKMIKNITVENSFTNPQIYNVYSDELTNMVAVSPSAFRLEPGEKQSVQITVKSDQSGNFAGFVSVVAADINRQQFNAATGVKIPLQITVLTPTPTFFQKNFIWFIIIVCLLILLLDVLVITSFKKKLSWRQKIIKNLKKLFGKYF